MSYFTVEQQQQLMFTQLPKALLYEDKYKQMTNDSKVLYSFLVDRVSLSLKNNFIDDAGRVYIKCSEITMAEILNKSEKTVRRFKKELLDKGLLEQPDAKNNKTMYYVKQPEVTVSKLDDYIADFQEVVAEKTKKEIERNREYRLNKAKKKVADFKAKNCNGNNDRSIENTGSEVEKSLDPLETLATVEITDCDQSKLPFSNNDFSNTDLLSMYVCSGKPSYSEYNSAFIDLYTSTGLIPSMDLINILIDYEQVFEYDLFEYLFLEIYNKFKAGNISNIENYLISALDRQSSMRNFTLSEYVTYKSEFNNTYAKKFNKKQSTRKADAPAEIVEQPEIVPTEKPIEVPEIIDTVKADVDERIAILHFRQANGLMSVEYFGKTLDELKAIVAEREN